MGEWLCMCQSVNPSIISSFKLSPFNHAIIMQSSCNHHAVTHQSLTIQSPITHHNHIHLQESTNSHTADPTTSQPAPVAISNRHQQLHADSSTNTE